MKLAEIKKCNTAGDLNALGIGEVDYDIGGRGGGLGFSRWLIVKALDIDHNLLPAKVGAHVNYLGGGVRGAICGGSYSPKVTGRKAKLLDAIIEACKRAYKNVEDEAGMNEDSEDDPNWEARATAGARKAGIKSAY